MKLEQCGLMQADNLQQISMWGVREGRTGDFSLDDRREGHTTKGQNKGRAGPSWEKRGHDAFKVLTESHVELFKDSLK